MSSFVFVFFFSFSFSSSTLLRTVLNLRVCARFTARIKKIKNLIGQGRYAEAAMLVGETALEDLRKGLLIGLTVKKTKRLPKLKPTLPLPFKPKGPKELFDLDNMMRFVDLCDLKFKKSEIKSILAGIQCFLRLKEV